MADTFNPVQVYYPNDPKNNWKSGWEPYKTLTANTAVELACLLHMGWIREVPKQ